MSDSARPEPVERACPEPVERGYRGILCIGDPHLCTWTPGYRKDDYTQVILAKLRWSLDYARQYQLLPVLLGDLFHVPRNNANWLVIQLMALLEGEILTLVGNHDLSENLLSDHDTLQLLLAAGRMRRLDQHPWIGNINEIPIALGGTGLWPASTGGDRPHGPWQSAPCLLDDASCRRISWLA